MTHEFIFQRCIVNIINIYTIFCYRNRLKHQFQFFIATTIDTVKQQRKQL